MGLLAQHKQRVYIVQSDHVLSNSVCVLPACLCRLFFLAPLRGCLLLCPRPSDVSGFADQPSTSVSHLRLRPRHATVPAAIVGGYHVFLRSPGMVPYLVNVSFAS